MANEPDNPIASLRTRVDPRAGAAGRRGRSAGASLAAALLRRAHRDLIAGLAVAAALVALVFLTSSSIDQTVTGDNTWSEIVITFLGAGACAAVVLIGGRGRAWGAPAVAMFAAFTAFAALSILWSVQPDWSWFGANQLLSYLAPSPAPSLWPGWRRGGGPRSWGAWPPRRPRSAPTRCWPRCSRRRSRPPTTTGACWRRSATGTRSACAPRWASRRRCGRRPAPRARPLLRALTIPAMTLMITVIALSLLALGRTGRSGGRRGVGGLRSAAAAQRSDAGVGRRCARCRWWSSR